MSEFDYRYVEELVKKAKNNESNAFAELFAATYANQYTFIHNVIEDSEHAKELLEKVYIQAFTNLYQLKNPHHFISWLMLISFDTCLEEMHTESSYYSAFSLIQSLPVSERQIYLMHNFYHMHFHNIAIALHFRITTVYRLYSHSCKKFKQQNVAPLTLDSTKTLKPLKKREVTAIFTAIMKESPVSSVTVPISLLEEWQNYRKPGSPRMRYSILAILVALLFFPLFFVKPLIYTEQTGVDDSFHAIYKVHVSSLLPISSINSTLNGEPVDLIEKGSRLYLCNIADNGTWTITAHTPNGQSQEISVDVKHLDKKKPKLIDYYTKGNYTYITLQDTYSGVDFSNISGVTLTSYDEEKSLIQFETPDSNIKIEIPDRAGNVLSLVVTPSGKTNEE